jgi:hypothetical protein
MLGLNSIKIAGRIALAFALVMPIAVWLLVSKAYQS